MSIALALVGKQQENRRVWETSAAPIWRGVWDEFRNFFDHGSLIRLSGDGGGCWRRRRAYRTVIPICRASGTPTWNGYSVGYWDGDTLVVETRGFRDNLWIDTWGSPMSDAGKMTEKFRRPNFGTLEIELTIDDPKVYTRPFTVNLTQNLEADTELVDEFCLEGENDYERLQRSRGK
jgi:hypothetical protein